MEGALKGHEGAFWNDMRFTDYGHGFMRGVGVCEVLPHCTLQICPAYSVSTILKIELKWGWVG